MSRLVALSTSPAPLIALACHHSSSLQQCSSQRLCGARPTRSTVVARLASPRSSSNNAVAAPRSAFLRPGGAWWKVGRQTNMVDVQSIQQLVDELAGAAAQEKLVVVEFFATWCTGCRALHPLMIQLAADRPEIRFLMIDGDENKALCRKMGVSGLPTIQVYCSSEGLVDQMQLPASKFELLTAAVERWSVPRCSLGGAPPLPGFAGVKPRTGKMVAA